MSNSNKQCTVFATFHIDPTKIEEWKEAHRPVWAACAREPECLLFDVVEDTSKTGRFRLVEMWSKDREWFETEAEVAIVIVRNPSTNSSTATIDKALLRDALGKE